MKLAVLLVEDDFDTLRPLSELLQLKGFGVITATDAEEGFRIAREQRPDLIITDIALPGPSGLHFILNVRSDETVKSTPIIVISGCGPMMLIEAESAGADICLEKPIDIDLFWAAINHISRNARTGTAIDAADQVAASEIDRLVEELRKSSSKDEREDYIKRLKESILKPQARKNCA